MFNGSAWSTLSSLYKHKRGDYEIFVGIENRLEGNDGQDALDPSKQGGLKDSRCESHSG